MEGSGEPALSIVEWVSPRTLFPPFRKEGGCSEMVRRVADHQCVPMRGRHYDAVFRSQVLGGIDVE